MGVEINDGFEKSIFNLTIVFPLDSKLCEHNKTREQEKTNT